MLTKLLKRRNKKELKKVEVVFEEIPCTCGLSFTNTKTCVQSLLCIKCTFKMKNEFQVKKSKHKFRYV